jgi:phage protein D
VADARDVTTMIGGRTSGPKAAAIFGPTSAAIVDPPVGSRAEAYQIAQAQINEMALSYIGGSGVCIGRADLRAGEVIKIVGMGRRFGGLYYVTATTHTYTPQQGYRTSFNVRRNAT